MLDGWLVESVGMILSVGGVLVVTLANPGAARLVRAGRTVAVGVALVATGLAVQAAAAVG